MVPFPQILSEDRLTRRILLRKPQISHSLLSVRGTNLNLNNRICHRTPSLVLWSPGRPEALHVFLSVLALCHVSLNPHFQIPCMILLSGSSEGLYSFCMFALRTNAYILVQTQRKEDLCYVAVFLLSNWVAGKTALNPKGLL